MTSVPNISATADSFGPVTKLAAIAAVEEEKARLEKRRAEQENLKTTASLVGETALAIAAARASGSPVRFSPAQQRHTNLKESHNSSLQMSVAARARAAANVPNNVSSHTTQPPRVPATRTPADALSSGNAGVTRAKFSHSQVEQMMEKWGRDDTSEDDEDCYYNGTSDSSVDNERMAGHHHLPYPMSQSLGRHSELEGSQSRGTETTSSVTTLKKEDDFHYQSTSCPHAERDNDYDQGIDHRSGKLINQNNKNSHGSKRDDTVGILASAKSWLQSQRERLHQLELERQVEDQRRRLVGVGRRQRATEAGRWRNNGDNITIKKNANASNNNTGGAAFSGVQPYEMASNSSLVCLSEQPGAENTGESCNPSEQGTIVTGMPDICGFGGVYANQSEDYTDYSGVARVNSAGDILELIPSGSMESMDGEMQVGMKVCTPKCTLSGNGMSVQVDLPDHNKYQGSHSSKPGGNSFVEEDKNSQLTPIANDVKVVPEAPQDDISTSPPILQPSQMKALLASGGLPPSVNFCRWKRLYSLSRDGDSFKQFLRLVAGQDRTILVIKTTHGKMFGGYADTQWEARHLRRHASEFYGSAQACLFRFSNYEEVQKDKVTIYKWSGANRYIQLCDAAKRALAFGGGGVEGDFGLCIEDDFRRGTTGHCSTFENDALCEEGYFDVLDLEVWGFVLDYF